MFGLENSGDNFFFSFLKDRLGGGIQKKTEKVVLFKNFICTLTYPENFPEFVWCQDAKLFSIFCYMHIVVPELLTGKS